MTEFSEEERRIVSYLRERAAQGEQYVRSRAIGDALGLSAKQVGVRLPRLDEKTDDVSIEKWGRARSTTWKVTLG